MDRQQERHRKGCAFLLFHGLRISNLLLIGATVYARVMVSLEPQRKYRAFTKDLGGEENYCCCVIWSISIKSYEALMLEGKRLFVGKPSCFGLEFCHDEN